MQIGDWSATAELNPIYRAARELGIETNLAELEAFGFTIVEPEKAAPAGFAQRMLEATMRLVCEEDPSGVRLNGFEKRSVDGRHLFHLIGKDPVFVEALLNPVMLTLARYLMGASARLYSTVGFIKQGKAAATLLHSDSAGTPPPLPPYAQVCNLSWILTDYTEVKGTFAVVPGSHRYCRHPTAGEQPGSLGGDNDEICIPVLAKPGSIFAFSGNAWHGAYPKRDDSFRAHIAYAFARNYVLPAEDFSDLPDSLVAEHGPDFAQLLGKNAWQGYHADGPDYARLIAVRRVQITPSA
ncbi:MAG TPA: phytanoyl-CoA dioxygenase family protein [Caulobacteraceae bacterium]